MSLCSEDIAIPIAVDLDGTLTLTDTLHESILELMRTSPASLFRLPLWLRSGKAAFKERLAQRVELDVTSLPYHEELIDWLKEERARGRKVILATAADRKIAQAVAEHLNLFDDVVASDGTLNLAGMAKRQSLADRYGENRFDYAGNSATDLDVWAGARQAIVVNASDRIVQAANSVSMVSKVLTPRAGSGGLEQGRVDVWGCWDMRLRTLRVHQWLKNLLLFVPMLAAHQVDIHSLIAASLAFVAFCLCASSVYVLNDLLDLPSDRRHPRKCQRPFASGRVPIASGALLVPLLLLGSAVLGLSVGEAFTAWLSFYFLVTFAYSFYLKKLVLVDCLVLTALYALRLVAGATAVGVSLSFWLLAFSIFIFLSLAFVKRYAELQLQSQVGNEYAPGRGYLVTDAPLVQTFGVTAGYVSVLVLAFYLQSDKVAMLYIQPEFIWLAVPLLLFWISWIWLKASRGQMNDDPIIFALRDVTSRMVALLVGAVFLLANFGFGAV